MRLKKKIARKRSHLKTKEVLFHQDNARSIKILTKIHELHFKFLLPDLDSSDVYSFADLKNKLAGKRYGLNEEIIAQTGVNLDKSF